VVAQTTKMKLKMTSMKTKRRLMAMIHEKRTRTTSAEASESVTESGGGDAMMKRTRKTHVRATSIWT
jgi:hypothetical protein